MNLLFIETGVSGGGSFESLFQLVAHLDRNRFNPIVVFLSETIYCEKFRGIGVEVVMMSDPLLSKEATHLCIKILPVLRKIVHSLFPFLSVGLERLIHRRIISKLNHLIADKHIDIVHLNNQIGRHFFGVFLKSKPYVKIISHLRSHHLDLINDSMMAYANQKVDMFVAYFDDVADTWAEVGVDTHKLKIIHNGIAFKSVPAKSVRHMLSLEQDAVLIGAVGKDIPERSYETLAKAMSDFSDHPHVHFVFIGEGEFQDIKDCICQNAGLASRIHFLGKRDDSLALMQDFTCLVMPYTICPFGRVLLEAWMSKIPVIASDVKPIRKIFKEQVHGLLFSPRNSEDLALKIKLLIKEKELQKQMTDLAFTHCMENFSIQKHVIQIETLYEELTMASGQ